MKNKISYFLLLCLLFGQACNDQLDLKPAQSLDENLALDSDENVKAVLNGAYDILSDFNLFGGTCLRNAELLGGDGEVLWAGTFFWVNDIFFKEMDATNADAEAMWLRSYAAINTCNNVLSALEVVKTEDRARVEGEALFIRGMVYFELVRFYAKPYQQSGNNSQDGVPIVLTPTRGISEKDIVARNSVEEVYTQVLDDLSKAEQLLPEDNDWRANKWAATALLSRVHLQMNAYAPARDAADRVIQSGKFSLLSNYADVFNRDENTAEDVFAIQITQQDGFNAMNTFFSIPDFGGRDGDVDILPGHLALYDSSDARLALFYLGNGAMRSGKWNNQYGNISLLRLAEMHLTRAECNIRLGEKVGAAPLDDYNAVHQRAGLPAATAVDLPEILLERRRELAHEGFRIHDIKRLKEPVGVHAFDACELLFPIPDREVVANGNLAQQACY